MIRNPEDDEIVTLTFGGEPNLVKIKEETQAYSITNQEKFERKYNEDLITLITAPKTTPKSAFSKLLSNITCCFGKGK